MDPTPWKPVYISGIIAVIYSAIVIIIILCGWCYLCSSCCNDQARSNTRREMDGPSDDANLPRAAVVTFNIPEPTSPQ